MHTPIQHRPYPGPGGPAAPAPRKGRSWLGWVMGVITVASLAVALWAVAERKEARDELATVKLGVREASAREAELQSRIEDLEATDAELEETNEQLEEQLAGENPEDENGFTAQDQRRVTELTQRMVLDSAGDAYVECALLSVVGSTADAEYAITHADLSTRCGDNGTDPAQFLWHRTAPGEWEPTDARVPGAVVCGTESKAAEAILTAIREICG